MPCGRPFASLSSCAYSRPARDLSQDPDVCVARHALPAEALQHLKQRLPVEKLHHQAVVGTLGDHLARAHDVGMVEAHGDPRLVQEHVQGLIVFSDVLPQLLDDRELAAALAAVRSQVDARHAAGADLMERRVAPDALRKIDFRATMGSVVGHWVPGGCK